MIRTKYNCLFRIVSVTEFGTKGNGVDDDTVAFQNAFDKAISENIIVFVPDGKYNLNGLVYNAIGNLHIIGQSKDNTILIGLGKIVATGNVSLKNISILNVFGSAVIEFAPIGFVNVAIENVVSINSDTNFTDKSRANTFLHFYNSATEKGIEKIVVKDCEFSGFASSVLFLNCQINNGYIVRNKISNIGYDANTFVSVMLGGYQDSNNVITAPAKNIFIYGNIIENIYSAYGASYGSVEGHAILFYGDRITIKNNIAKKLYGGGKLESDLESGYDHEMIYLKADNGIIDSNYIVDGAGNDSDGAIVIKGDFENTRISRNVIVGKYGAGIDCGTKSYLVEGNIVILNGYGINKSCVHAGCSLMGNIKSIKNNCLYNDRTRKGGTGGCLTLTTIENVIVSDNYMYSKTDLLLYVVGVGVLGKCIVRNNELVSFSSQPVKIYVDSVNGINMLMDNNYISFSSDGATSETKLMEIIDDSGIYKIDENTFRINSLCKELIQMQCLRYIIKHNTVELSPSIASEINRFISIYNNFQSSEINIVADNILRGSAKVLNFLLYYYGNNAHISNKIGTVLVKNNIALLTNGTLIAVNNGESIYTDDLIVENNYVKSSAVNKIIMSRAQPTINYTAIGNIER